MATEVGVGYVSIVPSAKGFGRKLSGEIGPDMAGVGRQAGEQVGDGLADGVEKRTGALRSKMAQFGPAIAAGLGVGIAMLGKDAVRAASDLGESVNAVQVTFGDAAAGILALGEQAATSVGLSKAEFNGLAVQFSNFAAAVAGPGGDVAGVMDDLTTRVADFASVMNLDVPEAATIFQSALSGETEPIRRFGIDLSAAAVESYALANGIGTAGKELTEQEKTVARYGLLMQSTAKTQGDFANTADGLANKTRIARAQFEDTKATLGEALLPVMTQVMGIAASLAAKFNDMSPGAQKVVIAVAALAAGLVAMGLVLGPIITAFTALATVINLTTIRMVAARLAQIAWSVLFGAFRLAIMAVTAAQWLWNIALTANPIGLIIAAIALFIGALVLLWKKNETFRTAVLLAWEMIKRTVSAVVQWFATTLVPMFKAIFERWLSITKAYIGVWIKVFGWLRDGVQKVADFVTGIFDRWKSAITGIWNMIVGFVNKVKALPGFSMVFRALGFANGGLIPGTGSGDRVPMMGEPGEFVVRRSAVQAVGVQAMSQLNATGQMPGGGGVVVENLTINNPVAEPASQSLPRTIRKLAYAGGLA